VEVEHHIVVACLLTRTFEPRQSQRYGVGGSSAFRNVCADAIVKSSTSLRNSVSLNSRMLAYAAATRSARTRALRSCVILISAMCTDSRVINPPSSGLNFKSQPNITPDECAAQRPTVFLKLCRARRPRRPKTHIYRRIRRKLRNLQSTESLAKRMFQSFQNWQTFRFVRASAWSPDSLRDMQEFILKPKEMRSRPITQIPRCHRCGLVLWFDRKIGL
jgi:hypothetical protein